MGLYKWTWAFVYSGVLVMLDDSNTCACVKTPNIFGADKASDDDVEGLASDNIKMLNLAILEKHGKELPDDKEDKDRILSTSDKLMYIPKFGYLLVNNTPVGVETKDGEKINALVATRAYSLKGKKSSFYLFDGGNGIWSGKIGHNSVRVYDGEEVSHFEIISYQR